MSTSQTPSPGRTPNGSALPPSLRRKAADPLVRRKRPDPTRPIPRNAPSLQVNGAQRPQASSTTPSPHVPVSSSLPNKPQVSTAPPQEEFEDTPVFTTSRAALEGVRYHAMRLLPNTSSENKVIDPRDESQFVRPVRLHRRDPRARPEMQWHEASPSSSEEESKDNVMDDKERAKIEAAKAEKKAEREANQAQIAPTAKKAPVPKKKNLQKKTELVYKFSDSARKEKTQRIRYEESLPWHLEDFENKNIWAGSYEAALSECHVVFLEDPDTKSFRMVPVEKWYKFTPKHQFKTLTIEEAEARMGKKIRDPRWFMETQKETEKKRLEQEKNAKKYGLFTRQGERGEKSRRSGEDDYDRPEEVVDADDIDYDYEEAFADDEENALFEGDKEESKQAEDKLMRERREANIFEIKEEKDYDEEEEEEKRRAEEDKKLKKKIEKALMKRERNFVYEDDSDRNPYASESESEDSDEEMQDEEEDQQQPKGSQEANSNDRLKTTSHERVPSGASSRGTSTPSGKTKPEDSNRKKRRNSPYQSEASGNESSRKKAKKTHVTSQPADPNVAGLSLSRPTSPSTIPNSSQPNPPSRKSSTIKLNMGSRLGNGPDGAAGSGSDAEMSEASRAKSKAIRIRGVLGSQSASPNGSRGASPAPAASQAEATSTPAAGAADNEPPPPLPTPEDIRSRIPPEGIELTSLMKAYGRRVVKNPAFVPLIKAHAHWVKEEKKFYPKTS